MLAAAALLASSACAPPSGAEVLWAPEHRFVVVGELHGTSEAPAAFAQLVCAAAEQGPVTVALELPTEMQPQLDVFLAAADDAGAAAVLHSTMFGGTETADGRTSVAMVEMMQAIRRLKVEGRDVTLRAFQPSNRRPASFDQNYYELDMAVELTRAAADRPESRVLVLVGNIHASKTRFDRFDLMLAAAHLPRKETVTLNVAQQGGHAWNCQEDGCGRVEGGEDRADPVLRTAADGLQRAGILKPDTVFVEQAEQQDFGRDRRVQHLIVGQGLEQGA